jgi:hypothetical protein
MSRSTPSLPKMPHGERFSLCTHISFVQFSVECSVQVEPVCVEAWSYALQHLYTAHLHPIQKGRVGKKFMHVFLDLWWLGHCVLFLRDFWLHAVGVKNILVWSSQFSANAELGNVFYKFLEIITHPRPHTCPPRSALDAGEIRGYCEPRPICGPSGCRAI